MPLAEHLSSNLFRGGSLLELVLAVAATARFEPLKTALEMALYDGTTNINSLTNGHVQPRAFSQRSRSGANSTG